MTQSQNAEIFISYAWGADSEHITNLIYARFSELGYNIIRDKVSLEYKGSIKAFMDRIGQGKIVVLVISEKYLQSENCMYELLQVSKQEQFHDRIFPVILKDANFYKPNNRLKYIGFWQEKLRQLNDDIKSLTDISVISKIQGELVVYREILTNISDILYVLKDMNTLSLEDHVDTNFQKLVEGVERRINIDWEIQSHYADVVKLQEDFASQRDDRFAYDVFLSFSNKDRLAVEKVAAEMRSVGLIVFTSNDCLNSIVGNSFADKIDYALENSRHFLLYCTPDAMASIWVKSEHQAFFSECYARDQRRRLMILKGRLFTMDIVPITYRSLQIANNVSDIITSLNYSTDSFKSNGGEYLESSSEYRQNRSVLIEVFRKIARLKVKIDLVGLKRKLEKIAIGKDAVEIGSFVLLIIVLGIVSFTLPEDKLRPENDANAAGFRVHPSAGPFTDTPQVPLKVDKQRLELPPKLNANFRDSFLNYEFVYIRAGDTIKADNGKDTLLRDYFIGATEITQRQWTLVTGNNPSTITRCDECPVDNIDLADAQAFVKKLNAKTGATYRLPNIYEWRFAYDKGKSRPSQEYSGSDTLNRVAWFYNNSRGKTHPVGTKMANIFGIYDMDGNVDEWTDSRMWEDNHYTKMYYVCGSDYQSGTFYYGQVGNTIDKAKRRFSMGLRLAKSYPLSP